MKLIGLLFIFCIYTHLNAQTPVYNQIWINGAYQKNFDIKEKTNALNIRLDGSYRSIEWFKYDRQFLIREITTYNFNDNWQLGAGPCWSWQYPYYDVKPTLEFRPTFQFIGKMNVSGNKYENGKFENNKSEISLRLRWEMRYFKMPDTWTSPSHRPRIAIRVSIPISEKLSFTQMAEVMYQKNPGKNYSFSIFRFIPGINYKHKKINYSFHYMFQFLNSSSSDEIDNNFLFNIGN